MIMMIRVEGEVTEVVVEDEGEAGGEGEMGEVVHLVMTEKEVVVGVEEMREEMEGVVGEV